jgi:hypothetical protein
MNLTRRNFTALSALAFLVFLLPLRAVEGPKGPDYTPVDTIKGVGNYNFGSHPDDFPKGALRKVSPNAKAGLLSVSPYGENYLVTDVKGLTWGNVPIAAMVVTFHDNALIDIQIALKSKNVDIYTAARAFKEKYGPSDTESGPVEAWEGDRIHVTMVFVNGTADSPAKLSQPGEGKVELFDQGRWDKVESAKKAQVNDALNKAYKAEGNKAKANL